MENTEMVTEETAANGNGQEQAESTELSAEELQEKLKESELQRDATEKALEQAKRSQAGSDKAVGEL
ncbi:MAG: hypothetical protein JSW06_03025, partial [Thermoplasmatales archaeon]